MTPIPKSRAGITLAELLTMIAVFAILVSALIPAFQQSREAAASAKCLNNLKVIGSGIQAYLRDYDDCLPDSRGRIGGWNGIVADAQGQRAGWSHTLQNYICDTSVFYCPADQVPEPSLTQAGSYMLRYVTSTFMPGQIGTVRNSMAKRPSRLVYVYERNNWHRNFGYPWIGQPEHPDYPNSGLGADVGIQYCNALFMDGHVASWAFPANRYTNLGWAGYSRFWFYGDVNFDKGINNDNSGLWSLIDFTYMGFQNVRCDPYDTVR